jgi:hypothetical protein
VQKFAFFVVLNLAFKTFEYQQPLLNKVRQHKKSTKTKSTA